MARSGQAIGTSIGESVCCRRGPLLKKVKTSMKMGSGADEVHLACGSAFKTMTMSVRGIYQPVCKMNA